MLEIQEIWLILYQIISQKLPAEAKEFLFQTNIIGAEKDDKFEGEVAKLIGSWKDHFNFWKRRMKIYY